MLSCSSGRNSNVSARPRGGAGEPWRDGRVRGSPRTYLLRRRRRQLQGALEEAGVSSVVHVVSFAESGHKSSDLRG